MKLLWRNCNLNIVILLSIISVGSITSSELIELTEDNWTDMLQGEWMVEFFAPWCPACKGLEPVWKDFSSWSEDLDVHIATVDVTASPGLSGRFMVTALPTIYHVKDGVFRQYRGARSKDDLISFVEEKKFETVDPIPGWKSPSSYQMSAVSYFFKLSMVLRSVHTVLIEEYGFPHWASYMFFALATIIIGAVLGLLLVCFVDLVYPQKPFTQQPPLPTQSKSDVKEDEDLEDEKIDGAAAEESEKEEIAQDSQAEESQTESDKEEGMTAVRKRKSRKDD